MESQRDPVELPDDLVEMIGPRTLGQCWLRASYCLRPQLHPTTSLRYRSVRCDCATGVKACGHFDYSHVLAAWQESRDAQAEHARIIEQERQSIKRQPMLDLGSGMQQAFSPEARLIVNGLWCTQSPRIQTSQSMLLLSSLYRLSVIRINVKSACSRDWGTSRPAIISSHAQPSGGMKFTSDHLLPALEDVVSPFFSSICSFLPPILPRPAILPTSQSTKIISSQSSKFQK
eukprot:768478-Hanusia_phi.AAC.3